MLYVVILYSIKVVVKLKNCKGFEKKWLWCIRGIVPEIAFLETGENHGKFQYVYPCVSAKV